MTSGQRRAVRRNAAVGAIAFAISAGILHHVLSPPAALPALPSLPSLPSPPFAAGLILPANERAISAPASAISFISFSPHPLQGLPIGGTLKVALIVELIQYRNSIYPLEVRRELPYCRRVIVAVP